MKILNDILIFIIRTISSIDKIIREQIITINENKLRLTLQRRQYLSDRPANPKLHPGALNES